MPFTQQGDAPRPPDLINGRQQYCGNRLLPEAEKFEVAAEHHQATTDGIQLDAHIVVIRGLARGDGIDQSVKLIAQRNGTLFFQHLKDAPHLPNQIL